MTLRQLFLAFGIGVVAASLGACSPSSEPVDNSLTLTQQDVQLNNRGVALMGYFDYAGAREVFRETVDRKPDWLDAKVNLAISTLNRQLDGDEALALQYVDEVITADPDHLRANYVAGLLRDRAGLSEEATAHYQKVVDHDPLDAYATYNLAVLSQQSDAQQALALFQRAIELDPYLRSAYYGAFLLQVRSGNREAGLAMKEEYEALASNPRAKLVETKYTRMGEKANALAVGLERPQPTSIPDGPLFSSSHVVTTLAEANSYTLTTVDIQSDGLQDIFVTAGNRATQLVIGNDDNYQSLDKHPLIGAGSILAVSWADVDNDGLVDAALCHDSGALKLYLQKEGQAWQESRALGKFFGARRPCADLNLVDADHDGDLDVFVISSNGYHDVLSNNGNGSFRSLRDEKKLPFSKGVGKGLAVADIDNDRDADLVVLNGVKVANDFLVNDRLWNYAAAELESTLRTDNFQALLPADLDADGSLEFYALTEAGELQVWSLTSSSARPQQWAMRYSEPVSAGNNNQLAVSDFNGDGKLDIVVMDAGSVRILTRTESGFETLFSHQGEFLAMLPVIADADRGASLFAILKQNETVELRQWPPGSGRGNFVSVSVTGKEQEADSMRSNRSGIGTRVAARRASHWTVLSTFDNHTGRGQSSQPVAIGTGSADRLDFVALDWSDGVFQTELDLMAGKHHTIAETQRQLSSCPVLFAWNGEKYEFVSDVLGVGGIGFLHKPGSYSAPRPWEYFLFPERSIVPRNGNIEIKITEPMEEIALIDSVRLWRYELAPGWGMVMDERMATAEPAATGEPLFFRREKLPVTAYSNVSSDIINEIALRDNVAADPGAVHKRFLGRLEKPFQMILSFDSPLQEGPGQAVLMADGWVEYPYSQTVFAAWQADEYYLPPTLEAADDTGNWQVVYPQFGYPAGMPRRMALPLSNLPAGTTQLRITSNLEIFWDRLSIIYAEDPGNAVKQTAFPLVAATLRQPGFPLRTNAAQKRPHYDYAKREPFWDSRYPSGYYSQLGDVKMLTETEDGAFAVIGPGEEVHLDFQASGRQMSEGSEFYVLYTAGFAKDMDMYTQDSGTVGPLPQTNNANRALHDRYNTRFRDGY